MFPVASAGGAPLGSIDEARLGRTQRQFEFSQRGAQVPEIVKGVAGGQQLGLLKLGRTSPEGHPHHLQLPPDVLAQVQVELMKKQIHPRVVGGSYAGLGLRLDPRPERTAYGVSLPSVPMPEPEPEPTQHVVAGWPTPLPFYTNMGLFEGSKRVYSKYGYVPIEDID